MSCKCFIKQTYKKTFLDAYFYEKCRNEIGHHECIYLSKLVLKTSPGALLITPEFLKGMEGIWTAEHFFTTSVDACLRATFLAITANSKLEFLTFQCNAKGKVEKLEGKFSVTEITLTPKLIIPASGSINRMKHIFEMSEKACAISNSIKSKIVLLPELGAGYLFHSIQKWRYANHEENCKVVSSKISLF